ncbi:MAG: peptide-methionine (S)-S-oxide reductase [Rhodospirillales bacterium 12-54-5]|nr:MAG: peptide-methionine (S)-S-oxide reductase [Rhodospirillales bacterium 12-54-5]
MARNFIGFAALIVLVVGVCFGVRAHAAPVSPSTQTLVVAGGCFWGVQAVFQHTKGVVSAISGYAGGDEKTAHYDMVSTGKTGHAEAVNITYDPSQISLGQLLDVYFTVAHNPTQLNYQGPDQGTQYRSAVFYHSAAQKAAVDAYIATLGGKMQFADPIVTTVEPLKAFYAAEDYHQNYYAQHPYNPYILINDAPKVAALQKTFPALYVK